MKIKINYLVLLSLFLWPLNDFAAWPSPEGLFRNSNNAEISGNLIILRLMAEELSESQESEGSQTGSTLAPAAGSEGSLTDRNGSYYKFIFSITGKDSVHFLQVRYDDSAMKAANVQEVNFLPGYIKKITDETDLERMLFYSIINVLVLNDSRTINVFLKRHGRDYLTNKELLDANRINLLMRYKRYLQAVKENANVKNEIESPLGSKSTEDKAQVNELMSLGLLNHNEKVSLSRENGIFSWKLDLQPVTAFFSNEQQRFTRLICVNGDKQTEIRAANYVLFDGIHELPKDLWFNSINGKTYKIRMLSLEHSNNKNERIEKVVENYRNALKEKKATPEQKPLISLPIFY